MLNLITIKRKARFFLIGFLSVCATACAGKNEPELKAQVSPAEAGAYADEWESWNRGVFAFNNTLDEYALAPAAQAYNFAVPTAFRYVFRNFRDYMNGPINMANSVLQGDALAIEHSFARFFINTTLGGLGFLDPASDLGYKPHTEDFGQTLASWGVPDGGYYMAPFFGPFTIRDGSGRFIDYAFDPMTYVGADTRGASFARIGYDAVDFRARNFDTIERFKKNSEDYYVTVRTVYYQRRQAELENYDLKPNRTPDVIDFDAE